MTVLVTGGAGYIGSHMAHALVDAGERVVVLDNLSTGLREAVPLGVPLIAGDIGDRQLVDKLIADYGVEAILHFAGSTVVPESISKPLDYYRNNTGSSRTLIEAAVQGGVRHFIFSSTAAVYGNPESIPVTEDMPTQPMSPYGRSKLMTEWILKDVAAVRSLGYVILRYFNVAGADPKLRTGQSTPQATHLIKVAAQTAMGLRPKIEIYGTDYSTPDGTCVRDYIHVTDLVAAHSQALHYLREGGAGTTLNCGYGHGFSVSEVINTVKRISKIDFPVELAPRRAGDPAQVVASAARVRDLLGWRPRFDDLDLIVAHALAWEKKLLSATISPR